MYPMTFLAMLRLPPTKQATMTVLAQRHKKQRLLSIELSNIVFLRTHVEKKLAQKHVFSYTVVLRLWLFCVDGACGLM